MPSMLLMQFNDLARQIKQSILPTVAGWNVCAMNSRQPPRQSQPVKLANNKAVMIHELVIVFAVADVALVGAVDVQPSKGRRID